MSKTAIIFSGQGSQQVKMGSSFHDSPIYQQTIAQIAKVRTDLTYLLTTANKDEIDDTLNAQITLFANQISIYHELVHQFAIDDVVYAGFSLGEYTAMCASGVLGPLKMARVIDKRAQAMAKENNNGVMKAVIGLKYPELKEIVTNLNAAHKTNIQIANYNQENQIVLAGTSIDFAVIEAELQAHKVRIIELPVSGAFHTDLYTECAKRFTEDIGNVDFVPVSNLYSNVTANVITEINHEYLIKHMTTGVNWYLEVQQMIADGVDTFIEINEKSSLLPMIKRINRQVKLIHIATTDDLNKVEELWQRK